MVTEKELKVIEQIISNWYHKFSYYSTEQSDLIAKTYVAQNKDIIVGIIESVFKEVKIVDGHLDLIMGEHDSVKGNLVKVNAGVTLRITKDGSGQLGIEVRDAIKPYHHAHIRFDQYGGARKGIATITCWGNVPDPTVTMRTDGFIQLLTDLIQFMGKSNDVQYSREYMNPQEF
jgi:hypothetical protein